MKAWYINTSQRTFVAGDKYVDDNLRCLKSSLHAVQYVVNTGVGLLWEVEISGKMKQDFQHWSGEETTFLKLYNLNLIIQDMGEYIIDELIAFLGVELIDPKKITVEEPAAIPLHYKDKIIDTVANLDSIIFNASEAIFLVAGRSKMEELIERWRLKLNKLIELSAPDKSIAA